MAPRSLLTPELSKRICDYAAEGRGLGWIAAQCKIAENTLRTWLTRGRKNPDGKHGTFAARYDRARDNPRAYRTEVLTGGPLPENFELSKRGGKKADALPNIDKRPRRKDGQVHIVDRNAELSQDTHDEFVALLNDGVQASIASDLCGVTFRRIRQWIRRGLQEPDGPYREFADAVKLARAKSHHELFNRLDALSKSASNPNVAFQATDRILKTFHPETWADGNANRNAHRVVHMLIDLAQHHMDDDAFAAYMQDVRDCQDLALGPTVDNVAIGALPPASDGAQD